MKRFLHSLTLAVTAAAAILLCSACNWEDSQTTNQQNFSFDEGTMTCLGLVDEEDVSQGTIWSVHLTSESIIEAYFVFVTEYNDDYVPAGTYTNATSLDDLRKGTFIPGSADETGTPQYSYVITGADGQYKYYSPLDNGSVVLKREETTSEDGTKTVTYTMTSSFTSYNTIISISMKGQLDYALFVD